MAGIGGIPGANPLSGLSGMGGEGAASGGMSALSGMVDGGQTMGLGVGGNGDQAGGSTGGGLAPVQPASQAQGNSFGNTLKSMVIDAPSASKAHASDLTARFAAGENIDPHQLSIANAKAGVEIQMATRSISSAVSAVRTLFQMQI